ncbi:MAG: ABC transporter substrate-binding protein [Phycisphaeraceae bacterium]|nr:ABC transporter substrate-binding protein [Phycisphaerales bacterium]MCB9842601.1 ABC transporter substrate-binding protein [Phycisphaeraceae bacterium]
MPAPRVVSLLPSATESLCHIGGEELLVGRSHECDTPVTVKDRPVLTSQTTTFTTSAEVDRAVSDALNSGTPLYRLDSRRVQELRPDVILTQDLCAVCSIDLNAVRKLAAEMNPAPAVVSLNPATFEDVLDDLITIGRAVGLEDQASDALIALRQRFFAASDFVNPYATVGSVVFLEWTDPPFIGGHWTPQLIERAGAAHPLNATVPMEGAGSGAGGQMAHRTAGKSVRVPPEAITALNPDHIIICPCGLDLPHTRREADALMRQPRFASLRAVRNNRVALVDGNQMFNRPGPRLVDAYEWLVGWLNDVPRLIPDGFPWESLAR